MGEMSEEKLNEYLYGAAEKYMLRAQAIKNSKTIKDYKARGQKFELMEADPKMQTLDEYIMKLQRGEIIASIPDDQTIEEYEAVTIKTPELGEATFYEPKKLAQKDKLDAYRESEDNTQDNDLQDEKDNKKEQRAKYRVVTLKGEDGKTFDLVLDQNGNDVGTITYDEKGKPKFNMAPELQEKIDYLLDRSNASAFLELDVKKEEFYLQDIDTLVRAIEEDMLYPVSEQDIDDLIKGKLNSEDIKKINKIISGRAITANKIKNGDPLDEKDKNNKTAILTPEEIKENEKQEEDLKRKIKADEERVAPRQNERDIVEEAKVETEKEDDTKVRAPETQPTLVRTENGEEKEDSEDEKDDNRIPEDKKQEIEEFCAQNNISKASIKAVLIVKDPKTLYDAMEKSNIKENGGEVTILQYSTTTGAPKVAMIQGGAELKVDKPREIAEKFIEKYHMTSGVIKRTEDNDTYIDYTDSTGKEYRTPLKRTPDDLSLTEKENFRERLEKDLAELNMVRTNYPDNVELIDSLEIKVYEDFAEVGLTPPETIKEDAEETKEEVEEIEEPEIEEDDTYDEIGRRIRPH